MEDCLRLLKGERDEQRLAGLLLATKFFKGDDFTSIRLIYDAVGSQFLDRLFKTGLGKGVTGASETNDQDAYLQLSLTVLATICRVPDIAASNDMISKIPSILDLLQIVKPPSLVVDECYEFLFLVSTASEDGLAALYKSGGMTVVASHMSCLPDASHPMELAIRLVQLMLRKLPQDTMYNEYRTELSLMVDTIARQFALLQNTLKFEVLDLLSSLLCSEHAAPLHEALRLMSNKIWPTYLRIGVAEILQNRVAPSMKFQALVLVESLMSILGETWLIDQRDLPGQKDPLPVDRCLLLVLETSRVEVAVLLNELAYLKYDNSVKSSSADIPLKQRNLAIAFSVLEKIIKVISNASEGEGSGIDESTIMKAISGLNETIGVVLEFLQEAKEHGERRGVDLLASVRIVGSYLAESPFACKEKIQDLLEYILLIEGEDEQSPFYSVCFMLPMLCQMTMEIEGCRILVSSKGFRVVVDCLVKLIGLDTAATDGGTIFLACDTIMNILLKEEETSMDESTAVHLLTALASWTDIVDEPSVIMMATSLCTLIFDSTSEEVLLNHPEFEPTTLNNLAGLIARSLTTFGQDLMLDDGKSEKDLHQIVVAGYTRWAHRFPCIKKAVEKVVVGT